MSQLDFEHLDHAYDDGAGLSQRAPGKATLTSRLARPASAAAGSVDAGSHTSLEGGLGIELSRPARAYGGGDDGDGASAGGGNGRRGLSFLGGGVDVGPDLSRGPAAAPAGRGLEYLGDVESTGFSVSAKLDGAPSERPGEEAVHALATAAMGGGEALPGSLRGSLEGATGASLGGVRVHTDDHAQTAASSINARAFARGQDIHFAPGQYDPASASGQHLIAHEVAHTIQQSSAPRAKADGPSVSSPTDSFEVEADRFADAFVGGSTAPISTGASQTTAFRAPDPAAGAPPPGKEGARTPDGRREFPKNAGPPPASMGYSVKPPTVPVKPGEPGPNVKQPPGGPPLPAQPLTAKGAAKGGAKGGDDKKPTDGKDAKAKAKGEGKGDDAAVAKGPKAPPGPPPPSAPQHAPVPSLVPVQPVVMGDPGTITEHEIKQWTTKTGRGPAEHRGEIEAVLSQLQSEIAAKQQEIAALGKQLRAELEQANLQRVNAFEGKIKIGSGTVSAAFDKITTGLTPLATKAKATVEQSRAEGDAKLKAAEATKGAELKAAFTAATTAVTNLSTKEAPAYEAIFGDFAKGLTDAGNFARTAADLESKTIVDKHKPEDCAGKSVPQARMTLEASLRQETAKTTTKDAKKKIDGIVNPAAVDVQKNAAGQVQALIKPYKDALDAEVKKTDTASKTNFATAVKTAQDGLTDGAKEANAAIDKAVGTAQGNITADKTTTMAMVEGAGKKATGEVKHAGQEMASRLDERAAKDANEIGALMQEAKGLVQGKRLDADKVKPKLQDILDDAVALATAADSGLRELLTKGKADLEDVIVKQEGNFATAITEGNDQATAAETKIQKEITKGADDFAAGHAKLVQGFDDTINKDIAKVTTVTATFTTTASEGLKVQEEQVRNRMMMVVLPDARKQLTGIAQSIPELAGRTAGEQIETKSKGASGKASKLRSAMDGWGTDENQIYGQLRDAGYGEIELIEATYDEHYAHRAGKGMSPLRYDLWDEMSGNELKIATAYLDHQRDVAIKLELQDCCGWNDDEDRIEAILRSASDDELTTLVSKEKATIDLVRDNLGGCDLDTVDALLDTDMDRDRRLRKADAIRVFDAMEGCGTDEAKVKALLEACTDETQRQMLREEFNKYTKDKPGWGATAKRDKNGKVETDPETGEVIMMDRLDSAIADDFSGHEANLVHALAEDKRDDFKIRAAKALYGGEGAGTDEHLMFEALDDSDYAARYEKATPEEQKIMRDNRAKDLNSRVDGMSSYKTMDALLDNDMGERGSVTYDEIEKGETKTGEKITSAHRARVNLEREVAQCKMERGKCPPSLQIRYSCKGNGTDEKLIKDALSPGGNPMAKGDVAALCAKYEADWGRTLAKFNELDVLDYVNFKGPPGDLDNELNGDDWFDVRMLLCGKPTTPEHLHYISKARVAYKTGGVAGQAFMKDAESIGYTETGKDLRAQEARYDALYDSLTPEERKMDLEQLALVMNKKRDAKNPDGTPAVYPPGHEKAGQPLPDDVFDRYSDYLQTDADAYGAAKASFVDALVTALEIIGGVLVTIATAGAASPVLAGIIANLIIAAGGIIIKRAALGDAYGADRFIEDAGMALLSAGVAVAEAKAFSKLATGAANKMVRLEAMKAAEEAGMEVVEEGVKIGAKGTRVLMNKALSVGMKTAMTESLTMVGQTLMTEEFWNGKLADTLLGENGLLAKLVMGVPKHMAAGMVRGAMEPFSTSRKSYPGSAFAQALTNVGANTAGILCYPDSYGDAQAFWDNMLISNAQAFGRGVFDGAANHKARAKNLGADFVHDRESADELAPRAAYLSPDEMKTIAEAAAKGGKGHLLPEAFKKYLPATNAPGDTAAPGAGGTDDSPPPPPPPPALHDGPPRPPDNDNPPPLNADAPLVKPSDAPPTPPVEVAPVANPHVNPADAPPVDPNAPHPHVVVDPNAPVTHVTDPDAPGAKPKAKMTPEELAADVQHRANEDRKNNITPEQRKTFDEIDGLATLATTPADWAYIRDLEARAGRPVSERHPGPDAAALPTSASSDQDHGKNADGSPRTKEQHDDAVAESQKDTPTDPTRAGARPVTPHPIGEDAGEAAHRVAENSPHVTGRAKAAVDAMDEGTRQKYEEAHGKAENAGQKALIDRALAAGNSMEDVHNLVNAMSGMSEADVLREFTGVGVVQFYHQSCVPTAYQIALAEMDPVFALKLRNNPDLMMRNQQEALINGGGAQTERRDLNRPDAPDALKSQLESGGGAEVANDKSRYSGTGDAAGIEPTSMIDGPLHAQLEQATGRKYVVVTNDERTFSTPGHGEFSQSAVPHGKIGAAVDSGLPVIISLHGHAQVIVGRTVAPDGTVHYLVTDPMTGKTSRLIDKALDVLPMGSISMPHMDDVAVAPHPGHVAGTEPNEATGATKDGIPTPDEDPGGRGNYHLPNSAAELLSKTDQKRLAELQAGVVTDHDDLVTLCDLRAKAAKQAGLTLDPEAPGTPEHMRAAYQRYLDKIDARLAEDPTYRPESFTTWAKQYPHRMRNSADGVAREEDYRGAFERGGFDARGAVLDSPVTGESRQVDVVVEGSGDERRVLIQIKSGDESLTTEPRRSGGASSGSSSHSNKKALALDGDFVDVNQDLVIWVFEGDASRQLIRQAVSEGVVVVKRVDNEAEKRIIQDRLRGEGMSEEDIGKVKFVVSENADAVIRRVMKIVRDDRR